MKYYSIRKYACVPFFPDDVEIELPKSYQPENADAPPYIADQAKSGSLKIAIAFGQGLPSNKI